MAKLLNGWPQPEGAHLGSVIDKAGPASYTVVTPATPPTGGQQVEAREFGLKYIEHVAPALSDNGEFIVYFTPRVANGEPVTSGILMWCTAVDGAEAAAEKVLSARTVRLRAIGLD